MCVRPQKIEDRRGPPCTEAVRNYIALHDVGASDFHRGRKRKIDLAGSTDLDCILLFLFWWTVPIKTADKQKITRPASSVKWKSYLSSLELIKKMDPRKDINYGTAWHWNIRISSSNSNAEQRTLWWDTTRSPLKRVATWVHRIVGCSK